VKKYSAIVPKLIMEYKIGAIEPGKTMKPHKSENEKKQTNRR